MSKNLTDAPELLGERQREILRMAREQGQVLVEPLAESFDVTPQTIRRDLKQLCEMRFLQRVHGGAKLPDGVANMGYEARRRLMVNEKNSIAAATAGLIPDDSSLFINIGTTTEAVARALARHRGLLVITNNLNVINAFRQSESIRLMTAGGTVRQEDGGIVGDSTRDFINRFKVDYAVIGVSAIEEDGALLDFDAREVRVAQAMISNARKVILVADSLKFERIAPVRIGNIRDIDYLVTDQIPSAAFCEYCRTYNVNLLVSGVDCDMQDSGEINDA
ncbi:DeoR/GlpR family DNA-binding transcription regulator [Granulosicoccaceae sp. 1_MG-2023]|nr:DeoR/GlpR family DNA-binding transcription regulator [Granulosicoccaceae sp. 1_MG-2023]